MRNLLILSTALLLTGCFDEATTKAKNDVLAQVVSIEAYNELLARVDELEAEVKGDGGLDDSRLDLIEAELVAARAGEEDLDARLSAIEGGGGTLGDDVTRLMAELGGTPAATLEEGLDGSRLDALEGELSGGTIAARLDALDGGSEYTPQAPLASLAGAVDANTASIGVLDGQISANTQGILDNGVLISTNSGLISTNSGLISTNSGLIADNGVLISTNSGLISTNSGLISTNSGLISTNSGLISDNGVLIADNAALIADNAVSIADNTSDIADLTAELDGSVDTISGSRLDALDDALDDGQGGLVDVLLQGTVTYTVDSAGGADFIDLHEALASLDGVTIAKDALVTLEVQAGTHIYSAPIEVNHPDGARIQIVGSTGASADTTLVFSDTDGLRVQGGSQLGLLDGLTLVDVGPTLAGGERGLKVTEVSYVSVGPSVGIEGFNLGVELSGSSWLSAPQLVVQDNYQGVAIYNSSAADLEGATIGTDGTAANSLDGLSCNGSSYVNAINSQVEGFFRYGMFAARGGVIEAWGSDFGTAADGGTGQANGTDRKLSAEPGDIRWIAW